MFAALAVLPLFTWLLFAWSNHDSVVTISSFAAAILLILSAGLFPVLRKVVRSSRFDRRYREFVLSSLRFIDERGLATTGFITPELDEVFVDVSLAYRAAHQVTEGLLAALPDDVIDRRLIDDFLDGQQSVILAIIGAPGSGKTALLRHTARTICRDRRGRRRVVPILLYLRDHAATVVDHPDVTLPDLIRSKLGRYGAQEPHGWFEQRLRDGDCVVLLDGLDEVVSAAQRRAVADWVQYQTLRYPNNDCVITSRPHGYQTASIDGAVVLQVRAFNAGQVDRFVRSWYLAVERRSRGTLDEATRRQADEGAEDLLERISSNPALRDLAVNPLLLTMIANVHRYRGALPSSRVNIYAEISQVMLWRRQEAKGLRPTISGKDKEALLGELAYMMTHDRVRDLSLAAVLAHVKHRIPTAVELGNILDEIVSSGLLLERENEIYSFAHITFQEYLAAMHIREWNLVQVLVEAVDDPWWRETTLLYAARSDSSPIVAACLDSGTEEALALAVACARESMELSPELRYRLDKTIPR